MVVLAAELVEQEQTNLRHLLELAAAGVVNTTQVERQAQAAQAQ